jgi:hypothetical protein
MHKSLPAPSDLLDFKVDLLGTTPLDWAIEHARVWNVEAMVRYSIQNGVLYT